MTGLWQAGSASDPDEELVALTSLVEFGPDQHDELESDFLGALMPFHFGGFHGVGPDGHPFAMMLQVAPASAAALVGSDNVYWPMLDGLDRALHYNWQATLLSDRGLTRDELLDAYEQSGVEAEWVEGWCVPELVLGLLAECCYVPLTQIVAGRQGQCAFPNEPHDCTNDVFSDVLQRWGAGELTRLEPDEEPEPDDDDRDYRIRMAKKIALPYDAKYSFAKEKLRQMSTKKLGKLALAACWEEEKVATMKRKELIKTLSTPHWRNRHEDAQLTVRPRPHD